MIHPSLVAADRGNLMTGELRRLADLVAHLCRGIAHRLQFSECDVAGHVFHAAIRRDYKPVRRDVFEPVPDAIRDDLAMYQQLGLLPAPPPFKPPGNANADPKTGSR